MAGRIAALSVVIHRVVDRVCRVLLESGSAQVAEMTVLQFGGIVADRTGVATALGMAAMLAGGEAIVLCQVLWYRHQCQRQERWCRSGCQSGRP